MVDIQAQLRSAMRKREALAEVNTGRVVRLVIAIEDTKRNRAALRLHLPLLTSQLPRTSREILRSLRNGTTLGSDGLLWLRAPAAGRADGSGTWLVGASTGVERPKYRVTSPAKPREGHLVRPDDP